MGLKTGQACVNMIKQFEGCKLTAYKCPAGKWTIGYGHTGNVKEGQTITQAQADAFLLLDLEKFEKNVNKYYDKYMWSQNEFDALVSFAYNVGSIDQLTDKGKRDKPTIAAKMLGYNTAKVNGVKKVLPGLTKRRKAEQELFLSGSASGNTETVHKYIVGKNYTLQENMYVREAAGGNKKRFLQLTTNAKSNGYPDAAGYGILKKGTVVTCKAVEQYNNAVWMKVPSGYICALNASGKAYIK